MPVDILDEVTDPISLAVDAAERLLNAQDGDPPPVYDEPGDLETANAALCRLGELFDQLPGRVRSALGRARAHAALLSGDRLQGIAEIVQNADDVRASQVRLLLRSNDLLVSHNGDPVQLRHVVGLATPWLSTKDEEADAIGRFGIGLMTLRSLSESLEVHCSPYHVRVGAPTVTPIKPLRLPTGLGGADWTTLRIPLNDRSVSLEEVVAWLDRWDDAALLFLRHVSRLTLLTSEGESIRELTLTRSDDADLSVGKDPVIQTATRQRVQASDGRSWVVYSADTPTPAQYSRARKATDSTTPIAVAFPLRPVSSGKVYAGLPVERTRAPLFVNAQFDPLAGRTGFAPNEWNEALVPLVAELWAEAALDLFTSNPRVAWHAMPITEPPMGDTSSSLVHSLEQAVADRAWQWLAPKLAFPVPGGGRVKLSELAVESLTLEGILSEGETASLAGLPATLPTRIRDDDAIWRSVLEYWRSAGADIPAPVTVEQALELVSNEARSPTSTIALTAAALDGGLGERLLELPCVVARDGSHLVPPSQGSPWAVAAKATTLAQRLGIVTILHDAHLHDGKAAHTVRMWLEECEAYLDDSDDRAVVRRLALAGRAGHLIDEPLTDEQAQALRDAFERMDPDERNTLGADVGRAILLEGYTHEGKTRRSTGVRPVDAYLPSAIDHEPDSFATAAKQTPGIVWLSGRYGELLRSPAGRGGLGSLKFLRLLGVKTVPLPHPHPELQRRYSSDNRRGLHALVTGSPESRRLAMRERDATYTLQDYDNPELQLVIEDISHERGSRQRRRRASALLATLGRAWERLLSDYAEVESAWDYSGWQPKGHMRAFWLWQAGNIAWLDDEHGNPRKPGDLRVRTPGTVAIYGKDAPDYLQSELGRRRTVLDALGVSSDPSRSNLVERLRELRDRKGNETVASNLDQEVAVVYQALASDLEKTTRSDLTEAQLRREFANPPGLVLTNRGWLPPNDVLGGPAVFGDYRVFAPQIPDTAPLWRALRLRTPSPDDCLKVLRQIARQGRVPDVGQEAVLLDTLRALASHYERGNTPQNPRLAQLALWTSKGWVRNRPVYTTDDRVLAKGLGDSLPLWEPGGDISQFRALLGPLRVEVIRTADTEVIASDLAWEDQETTDLFRAALRLLHEDLARNAPQLAASVTASWADLEGLTVSIHPSLSLRVPTGKPSRAYTANVDAKADYANRKMFVRSLDVLLSADGGGQALATLFQGNQRDLAHAWTVACGRAKKGIESHRIELARERSEREQQQIAQQLANFRDVTARNAARGMGRGKGASAQSATGRQGDKKAADLGAPRVLVDPDALVLVDPLGRIEEGVSSRRQPATRNKELAQPRAGGAGPQNRTPLAGYSASDRETVGKRLLERLLSSDREEVVDLRAQRGVGADAIDQLQRFYELKVSAGTEPDHVTLTSSEVKRASSTPDFFLVIVSGIEGSDARPKVRVVVDPLNQLQATDSGSITLSGVRNAASLTYDFAPGDGSGQESEAGESNA